MSSIISRSLYYDTSESQRELSEFCEIKGLAYGVVASCCGGVLSTAVISVVTSKLIWQDALYMVPIISLLAGVVFCGCSEHALRAEKVSSKVGYTLVCGVAAIPSLPFLIGALPTAGAIFAASACVRRNRSVEGYTEI